MIGGIGQTTFPPAAMSRAGGDPPMGLGNTENRPTQAEKSFRRPEHTRKIEAGFGQNTLSGPSAALDTLDVTLREAGRVVPSMEELMHDARAKSRQQALTARATAPPTAPPTASPALASPALTTPTATVQRPARPSGEAGGLPSLKRVMPDAAPKANIMAKSMDDEGGALEGSHLEQAPSTRLDLFA
jgi:hypothetical protein